MSLAPPGMEPQEWAALEPGLDYAKRQLAQRGDWEGLAGVLEAEARRWRRWGFLLSALFAVQGIVNLLFLGFTVNGATNLLFAGLAAILPQQRASRLLRASARMRLSPSRPLPASPS